jgi:Lar family restriction alleviation protein
MTDIERLRELLAKATPGPWQVSGTGFLLSAERHCIGDGVYGPDAQLIAAMHEALPNLLADYERLRGMEERVKGAVALRDCPFCGGNQPVAQEVPISHEHKWIVICNCCGVRTDHCVTEKVAVSLWNSRNGELVPVPGGEGK